MLPKSHAVQHWHVDPSACSRVLLHHYIPAYRPRASVLMADSSTSSGAPGVYYRGRSPCTASDM